MLERLGAIAALLEELREAVLVAGILQPPVLARRVEGEEPLVLGDRPIEIALRRIRSSRGRPVRTAYSHRRDPGSRTAPTA